MSALLTFSHSLSPLSRLQRAEWAPQGEEYALPSAGESGRLHQWPAVRLARTVQWHSPPPAASAEHHLADDRAGAIHEAVRHGEDRQFAPGNAVGRYKQNERGVGGWLAGWSIEGLPLVSSGVSFIYSLRYMALPHSNLSPTVRHSTPLEPTNLNPNFNLQHSNKYRQTDWPMG